MDASGRVLDVSHVSHAWTESEAGARRAGPREQHQDGQYESHFATSEEPHLLVGVAAGQGRALIGLVHPRQPLALPRAAG